MPLEGPVCDELENSKIERARNAAIVASAEEYRQRVLMVAELKEKGAK